MAIAEEPSLEFQALEDDEQLAAISRNAYRIPVEDQSGVSLLIESAAYRLLDVSPKGVRISCDDKPYLGDIVSACELEIDGHVFNNLKGRVVHSSAEADRSWCMGIQWFDADEANEQRMRKVLEKLRERMFSTKVLPQMESHH